MYHHLLLHLSNISLVYITLLILHGKCHNWLLYCMKLCISVHYPSLYQYVVCHITLRVLHKNVIIGYLYCMLPNISALFFMSGPVSAQTQACLPKESTERLDIVELVSVVIRHRFQDLAGVINSQPAKSNLSGNFILI